MKNTLDFMLAMVISQRKREPRKIAMDSDSYDELVKELPETVNELFYYVYDGREIPIVHIWSKDAFLRIMC